MIETPAPALPAPTPLGIVTRLERLGASFTLTWPSFQIRSREPLPPAFVEEIAAQKAAVFALHLQRRLDRGAGRLFSIEQTGDPASPEYERLLRFFIDMLCLYELAAERARTAA